MANKHTNTTVIMIMSKHRRLQKIVHSLCGDNSSEMVVGPWCVTYVNDVVIFIINSSICTFVRLTKRFRGQVAHRFVSFDKKDVLSKLLFCSCIRTPEVKKIQGYCFVCLFLGLFVLFLLFFCCCFCWMNLSIM